MMSLTGFTTQRAALRRFHSSADRTRFKIIELGVTFLVVKLASLLTNSPQELLGAARSWTVNPFTFFDVTTIVTYAVGVAAWWMAGQTAQDLDAIADPTLYAGETEPTTRLVNRYLFGGIALLVSASITRVSLTQLIEMDNPRIRSPILSALIYFFVGLALLGQVQYARLSGIWRREKVMTPQHLPTTWVRYTLLFIGLASLIAFALPTGYTISFMDLVATTIYMISQIVALLYMLILLPLVWLLSLLTGRESTYVPPEPLSTPFGPPPPAAAGDSGSEWPAIVRSIVFWVVSTGVVVMLIRGYVQDRPELLRSISRLAPWRVLCAVGRAIWEWLRGVRRELEQAVPALARRLRRRQSRTVLHQRTGRRTPRDQVLEHYLVTLERAREAGWPRRSSQTPREYEVALSAHLVEGQDAMARLTDAFVLARYSTHPITPQESAAQQENATQVLRELRKPDKR
jgi:hypothetical protein